MTFLSNSASLAAPVHTVQRMGDFPNLYSFALKVLVHGSGEFLRAMKDGAPDTSLVEWEHFNRMHGEFQSDFSGHARKEVLLVCFGQFMHQSRIEAFAAQVKAAHKLSAMGLRTMLAVGKDHPALCQKRGIGRMRLVSLACKVKHLSLWQVPTLHQKDWTDCTTNALKLEPYDFGWSAEHVFGFEGDAAKEKPFA